MRRHDCAKHSYRSAPVLEGNEHIQDRRNFPRRRVRTEHQIASVTESANCGVTFRVVDDRNGARVGTREDQCRRSHQLVSTAYIVRNASQPRSSHENVHLWSAIRDFEHSTMSVDSTSIFIVDVDHHARACWWSTSENSEKCPRVMRGKTSVPSQNSISFDLIGSCAEFVVPLTRCAICDIFREESMTRRARCFHDSAVDASHVNETRRLQRGVD